MDINFSKGDLLAGQRIEPKWYKGMIKADKVSIEGGRIDYVLTLGFDDSALSADERTVQHTFFAAGDKGKGFLVNTGFMPTILNKSVKEVSDGLEKGTLFPFTIGDNVHTGKKIQFLLINENFQGRILNKIQAFLPYDMEPPLG